jgi:hypothetical protein
VLPARLYGPSGEGRPLVLLPVRAPEEWLYRAVDVPLSLAERLRTGSITPEGAERAATNANERALESICGLA